MPGGDNGVVVSDPFVIHILHGPAQPALVSYLACQHGIGFHQAVHVLSDLLGDCRGKDPGVSPGVGDQFLFVKALYDGERHVGADLQFFRALALELRQVVKGRCFLLLFPCPDADKPQGRGPAEKGKEAVCLFLVQEPVVFIKVEGPVIRAVFSGLPLAGHAACLGFDAEVIRRHKGFDLPFPFRDHGKDAGPDAAYTDLPGLFIRLVALGFF